MFFSSVIHSVSKKHRAGSLCFLISISLAGSFMCTRAALAETRVFSVRDFGATGDGSTKDTVAISQAIIAANHTGGGEVLFPPGTYRTGTLELLSNVTLNVQAGAVILGSNETSDYGQISAFGFDHNYGTSSSGEGEKVGMIVARDVVNIAIIGQGAIDGNSGQFFDFATPHITMDFDPKFARSPDGLTGMNHTANGPVANKPTGRPGTMIILSHCKNVVIRDITLRNAPNWTLHLQSVDNAILNGLRIDNDLRIPNDDGLDCVRCRNVHVSDCNISAGDDDFAFVGSENVSVVGCTLVSNSSGIRLEDTRDSTFSDLLINANRGIGVYDRGSGNTANVLFSNLVMDCHLVSGHWWGKGEPILIASAGKGPGGVHDVRFSNVMATAESGLVLYGTHPDRIRHIVFDHVSVTIRSPSPTLAKQIGGNFDLRWVASNPSNAIFQHDIPALYGHNFQDLRINNFQVAWKDVLPAYFTSAIELEDFQTLSINGFQGRQAIEGSDSPAIQRRGSDTSIRNSTADSGTGVFLATTSVRNAGLFVGNDLALARIPFNNEGMGFTSYGNRLPHPRRQIH
jgi:hypothetical protein